MSPRINALEDNEIGRAARGTIDAVKSALGKVPNLHRTLAHSPAALKAYAAMSAALSGGVLPAAIREQIAVATAGGNGCQYCASAHTALGEAAGVDGEELRRNLRGESADPRAAAALRLVRRLLETRGSVDDADLDAARAAGFGDAEIIEIAAHVGLNTYSNVVNNLARTEIDFPEVDIPGGACVTGGTDR